jgi:hypothetical protein
LFCFVELGDTVIYSGYLSLFKKLSIILETSDDFVLCFSHQYEALIYSLLFLRLMKLLAK